MDTTADGQNSDLLGNVLLPIANDEDAVQTAKVLKPYDPETVTAFFVVEKGGGAPDKTPVKVSEEMAAEAFEAVKSVFPDAREEVAYKTDVVDAIFDAAAEIDATAIAYRSRGGNRLLQFLSGDHSIKLVTKAQRPVIALPNVQSDE